MILASLVDYYERRARDPDPARRLPAAGLEDKAIPFVIELSRDGQPLRLIDTRELDGKKLRARTFLVPKGEKKTSGVKANLLWDTAEYVLGTSRERKSASQVLPCDAFRSRIDSLPDAARKLPGVQAVLAAVTARQWQPLVAQAGWDELVTENLVVTFRLVGEPDLVCQHAEIVRSMNADSDGPQGHCLVTGRDDAIARLHPSIRNVWGAQSSGASLVSFNQRAFESYGKAGRQGDNAPVGAHATFAYTTALNHLLERGSRNRVQVGDTSTVFWADRETPFDGEFSLADFFGEDDDPDRNVRAVQALLAAVRSGQLVDTRDDARFFVLGLAPNAARLSVRYWLHEPLSRLGPRILAHFDDLRIVRQFDGDARTPSIFRLLTSVALLGKADNIPPRLAGEWMRAILEGAPYPAALLSAAVSRCRAEQSTQAQGGNVPYLRAATIKACLNREQRRRHPHLAADHQHFKEELDVTQEDTAYRLGRLFALLERIQQQAQPGINATIRDRYYGAASTTPVAVFTTLLRLKNAHLKKLGDAAAVHFERAIGDILGSLDSPAVASFPSQLTLEQQGRFALGYYHQRQSFFARQGHASDEITPTTSPGD